MCTLEENKNMNELQHVRKFKKINYIAGIIQLILCIFLVVWLGMEISKDGCDNVQFNIGEYNGMGKGRSFGDVPVSIIVLMLVMFTGITSCVHIFGYAQAGPSYQDSVDDGKNWKRWMEYSVTATIMMVVIALSSGVGSVDSLLLISVATLCCMVCGWLSETTAKSDRRVSQVSTVLGWALLLVVIGVIMRRFTSIVMQANDNDRAGPPWWVFCIVITMFLLYSSFGFIHLLHMRNQWKNTDPATSKDDVVFNRRVEGAYTSTSMVSKILLVVLLASGLFARERSGDVEKEKIINDTKN